MADHHAGSASPTELNDDDVFVFPVSFAQRRLWLIDRLEPGNPAYNIPAAVRFQGPLDPDALTAAINEVVARHESLRTNFQMLDDEPKQIVSGSRRIELRRIDLSNAPEGQAEARRLIADETIRPFDLAADPLLRAVAFRLGDHDHIVLLTIHHIVSDGWSMGVLVGEISQAYAAFRAGAAPVLPPLDIQYGDYAEWQRDWLTGEVLERHLSYWRAQLASPLPILNLLTDRARPAIQTFNGGSVAFSIPADTSAALGTLARSAGATLFMGLLAGFNALLFRYTGQDDILVGSPIANRGRRELEPLIGFFVNTLVLRTRLSPATTFRELLCGARETTMGAYAHQDLPFEHLVDALHPERSLSHTPLFQILFALQNTPAATAAVADVAVTPLVLESATAKFDLSVSLTETGDGLTGAAEFNTDLFDRSTIERLTSHFTALLSSVVATPDASIGRLPLVSDTDRRLVAGWNDTSEDYPGPWTIHGRIEETVTAEPNRPAVWFEGETLTYRELNDRANQLAHFLGRRGVSAETVVGVCLERSLDLIVALVGILKAGGAYLPLDPTYPPERLRFMLEDAAASRIVTWRRLAGPLGFADEGTTCLDELSGVLDMESRDNPEPVAEGGNAAYVIFTSGSTGRPKGAVNTHRAIVNRLRWMQAEYGIGPDDRVLQKTPFGFDVSVWELFAPLVVGACLVVARPDGHKDPAYLTEIIDDQRITTVHFVPSMLRAFLDAPRESACPSIARVLCSGEALPYDLQHTFFARFGAELSNLYGPTEAAVEVTFWRCRRDSQLSIVPIGAPIANARIHIVDETFTEVPVGVPGELLIGGLPVARGYVGRPELTAERFVPDPFGAPGARLYRTGDRARWLATAQVEFLGRLDFQIKIRGFRVEAGEIETRLRDHPDIGAALVLAREDRPGDLRLVAYVVAAPGATPAIAALRQHVGDHLPDYMVPAAFVVLPFLPLLSSGKVDRGALPAPSWGDGSEHTDVLPRTSTEEILLGIWRELLGVGQFGVEDNFFTLGGHSLLATQVVSRIAVLFAVELPLRAIFERSTVRTLAGYLDDVRRESAGLLGPSIAPVPRDGLLRPSFAQQRLWFLNQIDGTSSAYNMPAALRIDGLLDVAVLERTLEELMRRHEVLRSRFVVRDGLPVTIIDPEPRFTLAVDDLSGLPAAQQDVEVARRAAAEFDLPFNLAVGPLVRSRLLKLSAGSQVLLLTAHHIVSDGWSTALLVADLVSVYDAYLRGLPSPLPPLRVQYADFAEWQRSWLSGPVLEAQLAYWKRQLAGAPPLVQLPTDWPRPAVQTFDGATTTFALGPALAAAVRQLSARAGSTTFMTMLSAFLLLLSRYARQQDVVVGAPMAGRTRKELEPLVGFFLNTLVIRGDLSGDPTFRELVERVRQVVLDAYAHQDVPFEQIVEAVQPERSTSVTPLFQIVFSGAMTQGAPLALTNLRVTPLPPAKVAAKFDLTVGIGESDDDITGAFEYNTALFREDTMRGMSERFTRLLASAAEAPDARISTLSMMSDDEQRRGIARANAAPADARLAREAVPSLVAETARRRPSAAAVRDATRVLTYAELDGRANTLAHRLIAAGLRREGRVGVCLERSADMVVALLAVLKAGATYVPLDPGYPAERLRFMVEDSGASLLLVSAATAGGGQAMHGLHTIDIASIGGGERSAPPDVTIDLDALAYVIYTSGSTGTPKGVEVSHRALLNLVDWHNAAFDVTESDRASQVASIAFDAAVWETWPCLVAGAELHVADEMTVRSPAALVRWLVDRQVTVSFVPTPLAEQVLRGDWRGSSLRHLLTGGDTLHTWAPDGLPFTLVNNYGPTENTVVATSGAVVPHGATGIAPSIGLPIAGTQAYLVDEHLNLVPAGVPGELLIGGRSLARGYHRQPALTAERFVPDPFAAVPGARLYRTGDLARWREGGSIEFLGRIDRQVKVRGVRIELAEIEAVLAAHDDVARAAVIVRDDGSGQASLVAYVVTSRSITTDALRGYLRGRVPESMVPSAIVFLEALPLTGTGKTDTRALASTPLDTARTPMELPRTETERLVAGIWASVLDLPSVGVHDNFFDVGGHSLKLIDVHGRLQEVLRRELSIVDLFRYPTVSELAAFLSSTPDSTEDALLSAAEERAQRQRGAGRPRAAATEQNPAVPLR